MATGPLLNGLQSILDIQKVALMCLNLNVIPVFNMLNPNLCM